MLVKPSNKRVRKIVLKADPRDIRQAREVLKHLEDGWLPVNPQILTAVQKNLELGTYDKDPLLLIEEVKSDPGLFFHVAKNLKAHVSQSKRIGGFDPISQLKTLEAEKLGALFEVHPESISPLHARESPSVSQAAQTKQLRLSAMTAETIAKKLLIQPDHAFSNAAFRQLGLELVAWNYPHIFARALSLHKTKGEPIEHYLRKTLGISPQKIALQYARKWGMSNDIEKSINYTSSLHHRDHHEETFDRNDHENLKVSLGELCQLSELYAKAQDPQHYPTAPDLWAAKEIGIKEYLGKEVLEEIEEKTHVMLEEMEQPEEQAAAPKPVHKVPTKKDAILDKNHYLKRIPTWLQKYFVRAYKEMNESEVPLDAIRILANKAVPQAGFIRGCLYLQDKEKLELEPALRFGDTPLENYKELMYNSKNGITTVMYSQAPLKQAGRGVLGDHVTQICGSLRNSDFPGVLYLEIADEAEDNPEHDAVSFFHAIRQTLSDCLSK